MCRVSSRGRRRGGEPPRDAVRRDARVARDGSRGFRVTRARRRRITVVGGAARVGRGVRVARRRARGVDRRGGRRKTRDGDSTSRVRAHAVRRARASVRRVRSSRRTSPNAFGSSRTFPGAALRRRRSRRDARQVGHARVSRRGGSRRVRAIGGEFGGDKRGRRGRGGARARAPPPSQPTRGGGG